MLHSLILLPFLASGATIATADSLSNPTDSLELGYDLEEFVLTKKLSGRRKMTGSAFNTEIMTQAELKRAACCNLGESFTTNPSVDVNYSDAATGAKQVKLLGLPGTYVQMLTENIPNLRGAGAQFGLGYIPGPWMQSIQVSKGASSVKNGYESVTGQINIEMLKPQADQSLDANMYADHKGRVEANFTGNLHLGDKWSTGLLVHGENTFATHDENDDGFADTPKVRQIGAMNRWAYMGDSYIFQAGVKYLGEKRESGQIGHHASHITNPYLIDITTNRGELFMKNAYIFDPEHNGNVALMLSGSIHDQKSDYGHKVYDVNQKNFYASLMFERDFGEFHSLSTGLSVNHDYYNQSYRLTADTSLPLTPLTEKETTPGAYAQYTFNYDTKLILMGGLRYDYSTLYGHMFTPRVHARWNISTPFSLHLSAGKGYRSPYALVDNSYLLASSREIIIEDNIRQEEAWNFGGGVSGEFNLFGRSMNWNAEYYYTDFRHQTVVDLDYSPFTAIIKNINGKSYSHAAQVELSYQLLDDLNIMAAYRYNDVKVDYGRGMVSKPLTSKSKALFSVNYTPMMGLWQFDATLALTGGGRMPTPSVNAGRESWNSRYKAFPTLNAQITRNFRHWSIYIGGENLTNYRQKNPIVGAANPWGPDFDATMIYAPIHGAMAYIGFRYTFTKY
jgi:outer membrane receptor for ferrienterochelin and colicin